MPLIRNIDAGLERAPALPTDIELYRGEPNRFTTQPTPGEVITLRGFVSTTIDENVTNSFGAGNNNGVRYIIQVPDDGTARRGFYMESLARTPHSGEQEILLPRDSRFEVVSAETVTTERYGITRSILELVVNLMPQ